LAAPKPQATGPFITVSPDDPDITAMRVTVPGLDGFPLAAYISMPRGAGPFPGVLVIHENQGWGEHYRDITRRFAKSGFAALVIALLSRAGGAESIPNAVDRGAAQGNIPADQLVSDLKQGLEYLKNLQRMNPQKIGATGYCFGGGMTWRVALAAPDLDAAV